MKVNPNAEAGLLGVAENDGVVMRAERARKRSGDGDRNFATVGTDAADASEARKISAEVRWARLCDGFDCAGAAGVELPTSRRLAHGIGARFLDLDGAEATPSHRCEDEVRKRSDAIGLRAHVFDDQFVHRTREESPNARGQRLRSAARDMHGNGKAVVGSMARDARSSSLHLSG